MPNCQRCGAHLAVHHLQCGYCGAPHAEGIAWQRAEEERRRFEADAHAARQHQAQAQNEASLARASRNALIWSLVGLPLCCIPVPSVLGLVLALRARKLAVKSRLPIAGNATAALVLGIAGVVASVALYVFVILDMRALAARRQELQTQVEAVAASAELTQPAACALVELWLLENPLDGHSWSTSDHFDCPGRVEQKNERATLPDLRVRHSSKPAFIATACLKRGARWMVEAVHSGSGCTPDAPAPAASASAL